MPDAEYAVGLADGLIAATAHVAQFATTHTGTADHAVELLRMAVGLHDEHGDGPCPACGIGTLAPLGATAEETLDRLRRDTTTMDGAGRRLQQIQAQAARLLLDLVARVSLDDLAAIEGALDQPEAVWRFRAKVDELRADQLATHLRTTYPPLLAALAELQDLTRVWLR
jgi:hypothetical protein